MNGFYEPNPGDRIRLIVGERGGFTVELLESATDDQPAGTVTADPAGTFLNALQKHRPKTGMRDMKDHCICGWSGARGAHLAHLADALAALDRPLPDVQLPSDLAAFLLDLSGDGNMTGAIAANFLRDLWVSTQEREA